MENNVGTAKEAPAEKERITIIDPGLPNVSEDIRSAVAAKIKPPYAARSNWASKLGHPCARHGVHARLDWESREPISVVSEMIFRGGDLLEQTMAKNYLEQAGYKIVRNNERPDDKTKLFDQLQIGCKLDFIVVAPNGLRFPIEVKTMQGHYFDKLDTIEDMLESPRVWHNCYPAQLILQMLGGDFEYGMFLMINKANFDVKHIWAHLDYSFAERLLARAELINKHVAANTYPDRIKYNPEICGKCDYARACLGDVERKELVVIDNAQLTAMLKRREELKAAKADYEKIDEAIKDFFGGKEQQALVGEFVIRTMKRARGEYTVKPSEYFVVDIKKQKAAK